MNRGLRTAQLVALVGMACVLLVGSGLSPQGLTGSDQMPRPPDRYDVHLVRRPLVGAGQAGMLGAAGAAQTLETGRSTDSARAVTGPGVPPLPGLPPAAEETLRALRPAPSGRRGHEPNWSPFATVGGLTLLHPASRVERIGFHESNHDGARQLEVHPAAIYPVTLPSRGRGTGSRSAADVVVDPEVEIRVPVSGTVIRSGTYRLYCEYSDDFAVIDPEGHPGEVKALHIEGVRVEPGDRVKAGVTVLARRARQLPMRSQVDDYTAEPSWPHVHIEVIDPSIPDRPSSGGGC